MRLPHFLEHHGIAENPFSEEDAQTDPVFKRHCVFCTYHPAWDKIYGDPSEPATAVVFGEKGAGKTAMRIQIARHLAKYNADHAEERIYTVEYDDFNPYLDRFANHLSTRQQRPDRMLRQLKLWDHMDAIISISVTRLVDAVLKKESSLRGDPVELRQADVDKLDRHQARDLLLLAALYDQSTSQTLVGRWHELRKRLGYFSLKAYWDSLTGIGVTATVVVTVVALMAGNQWWMLKPFWVYLLIALAGWTPWMWKWLQRWWTAHRIVGNIRVGHRHNVTLRRILRHLAADDLEEQPLPTHARTDDRYELLSKFRSVLRTLGYTGMVVLVDRVDEPHMMGGSADLMQALVWPMLDNKFLKQEGVGVKMMLPIELTSFIDREDREFYERARLDKQNMVPTLEWTGEALYDVATARLRACAKDGSANMKDLFDESITEDRLIAAFRSLRVPRHLFKFLYRLLVAHCNAHTDEKPVWKIRSELFEAELALFQRQQDAFDRGLAAG